MPDGSILSLVDSGEFVVSLEIDPPTPRNIMSFPQKVKDWKTADVKVIDINTSKLEPSADSLMISGILSEHGFRVVPHIAIRDNGIRRFINQLFTAYYLHGLRDVLVIKGDSYKLRGFEGECPISSIQLIHELDRELRMKKICPELKIGAAFNYNAFNISYEIEKLKCKDEIGADCFWSQPIFDEPQLAQLIESFRGNCARPLFVGIFPLPSSSLISTIAAGNVPGVEIPLRLRSEAEGLNENDLRQWAIESSVELIASVKATKEIAGVYIVAPRSAPSVALEIFKQTKA